MLRNILILVLGFVLSACTTTTEKPKDIPACDPSEECTQTTTKESLFEEITMEEALSFFQSGKDAILYFGFDDCPWCKEAAPILKEVADQTDQKVLYVKVRDENHDLMYTDQQREQLSQYISEWMRINEEQDGKLWLYVPLVICIKDGTATDGHEGTVDDHDATERSMTEQEKKQLEQIYTQMMD